MTAGGKMKMVNQGKIKTGKESERKLHKNRLILKGAKNCIFFGVINSSKMSYSIYSPDFSKSDVLSPSVSPQNILFWRGLYCRQDQCCLNLNKIRVAPDTELAGYPAEFLLIFISYSLCKMDHGQTVSLVGICFVVIFFCLLFSI